MGKKRGDNVKMRVFKMKKKSREKTDVQNKSNLKIHKIGLKHTI